MSESPPADDRARDRRAAALLLAGGLAGILLAGWGIARSGEAGSGVPAGAVAVVNGQPISAEAFARFVGAVASERRQLDLDGAERRRLLERMIDEELLLQRGLALGLARYEATARRAIVAAVIAALTSDAEAVEPGEAELRAFYEAEAPRFTRAGRLTVDACFVAASGRAEREPSERAAEIARRLRAGEPFAAVDAALADPATAPLPSGPLPLETLRQYLGPTAARAAERMEVGEVSDPIRGVGGYHVLVLRARAPGVLAAYDDVREQVRAEYLRTLGERALRSTLEELRAEAEIGIDASRLEGR